MAAKNGTSERAISKARALGQVVEVAPMGRPRTKVSDLPTNWKEIMHEEAEDGGGPTAFLVKLKISHTALQTLLTDSKDFRNTFEECILLQQYWWERQGRKMASGADGNSAVWSLNMTNRFNWRSGRNEVIGDKTAPVQIEVKNQNLTKEELIAELVLRGLPTSIFKD
jgi:hypothetical protein